MEPDEFLSEPEILPARESACVGLQVFAGAVVQGFLEYLDRETDVEMVVRPFKWDCRYQTPEETQSAIRGFLETLTPDHPL